MLQQGFRWLKNRLICTKLATFGVPNQMIGWIKSYLENQSIQFHIEDVFSEDAAVPSGVPQG